MMQRLLFTCGAAAFLLLGLGVGFSRAASSCEERLGDKLYRCEVTAGIPDGPTESFEGCIQFDSAPDDSPIFSLSLLLPEGGLPFPLTCTCKASGKPENPEFNGSNDFICATGIGDSSFYSFEGSVKGEGKKIKNGHLFDFLGGPSPVAIVGVFECKVDPSCVTPTLPLAPPSTTP